MCLVKHAFAPTCTQVGCARVFGQMPQLMPCRLALVSVIAAAALCSAKCDSGEKAVSCTWPDLHQRSPWQMMQVDAFRIFPASRIGWGQLEPAATPLPPIRAPYHRHAKKLVAKDGQLGLQPPVYHMTGETTAGDRGPPLCIAGWVVVTLFTRATTAELRS